MIEYADRMDSHDDGRPYHGGIAFIYFLGTLYTHQWRKLSAKSTLRVVVERALVPLVPAMFGTWFAEPRYGDRFFYLQYAPRRRIDMLPLAALRGSAPVLGDLLASGPA